MAGENIIALHSIKSCKSTCTQSRVTRIKRQLGLLVSVHYVHIRGLHSGGGTGGNAAAFPPGNILHIVFGFPNSSKPSL